MPNAPEPLVPELKSQVPAQGNALTRGFGRLMLRLLGWKVKGELPDVPKAVFAAAPHTSNWDFILAMFAVLAMGVKISYLMKKEAFIWPLRSVFLWLGGIPLDRSAAADTVEQISGWFSNSERLWVVITPEGTRSRVPKWKTGFLRVAHRADVPVVLVAWDFPSKTMHIDRLWHCSGDHELDAEQIRAYICKTYRGRHPQLQ
ncbi:lysophospholipid acyltransferase family protein [Agaribacterium haliotis]|uniref:lysophospholipid acyltransferase family protein n=1 Tax=Agaribacterium haliotis TaxID=2013869 RepID=UPI000BB55F02|nr:lysophospholipid acyltransferase family protein [Agaribacterium haliotis]